MGCYNEFEIDRNAFELQKNDNTKQIELLELEVDELKIKVRKREDELDKIKNTSSVLKADFDRIKKAYKKERQANMELIKNM